MLAAQANLALTYDALGRLEEALHVKRDVYSGRLKLHGEEHEESLRAAINYAHSLMNLQRFEEGKSLMRKWMPVAQRVFGESNETMLRMRWIYGEALCVNPDATLDDLREAVTTLEDAGRIARRVLGGAHPTTGGIEHNLQNARAALRAGETPSPGRGKY